MTLGTLVLYGIMRVLSVLACTLPRRFALAIGSAFASAVWALYRLTPVRDFVPGNVQEALPEADARLLAKRSLILLTRAIVEVMRFPTFGLEADRIVRFKGREHLDRALAGGKGAIILTAHFGNWELLGAAIARSFRPMAALVQTPSKGAFARLFVEYRRIVGVETHSNSGPQSLRPVIKALRRGEIVTLLCDQHGEAREGSAAFLGHRVWVPLGPFTLARRTGAAIVPARIVRDSEDQHVLEFFESLEISADADRNAQAVMASYEGWIRENPDHWLWVHNRWEKAEKTTALPRTLALVAFLIATLGGPALAAEKPLIVAYKDRLVVLDTLHPDTHGAIPLPGRAEAALYLPARQLLIVHMPGASALSFVDLEPFSPNRYQAITTYRAPELGVYDLGLEEVAGKVLLGFGKTPIAEIDIASLAVTIGYNRPETIPFPFSTGKTLYLPAGVFVLKKGQLHFEDPYPNAFGEASTPQFLRLVARPSAMVPGPSGKVLYVAETANNGKGYVAAIESETRRIIHELPASAGASSLVWLDDRTLAVLAGNRIGLLDVPLWRWKRWIPLGLPGGPPIGLLPNRR